MVRINPLPRVTTGFGYSRETSSFALHAGIMAGDMEFSYGIRFHPYLGYSHSAGVTCSADWDCETLSYGRKVDTVSRRININKASYDELMALGLISEKYCRRIILYREQMGPLEKDALVKIGMPPEERRLLLASAYGFSGEEHNKGDRRVNSRKRGKGEYVPRKERVRRMFQAMVDRGIPVYEAALYSDLAASDRGLFAERLAEESNLSDEQKKIVRGICFQ